MTSTDDALLTVSTSPPSGADAGGVQQYRLRRSNLALVLWQMRLVALKKKKRGLSRLVVGSSMSPMLNRCCARCRPVAVMSLGSLFSMVYD